MFMMGEFVALSFSMTRVPLALPAVTARHPTIRFVPTATWGSMRPPIKLAAAQTAKSERLQASQGRATATNAQKAAARKIALTVTAGQGGPPLPPC